MAKQREERASRSCYKYPTLFVAMSYTTHIVFFIIVLMFVVGCAIQNKNHNGDQIAMTKDLSEFEKMIQQKIPKDPRTDDATRQEMADTIFPSNDEIDGTLGLSEDVFGNIAGDFGDLAGISEAIQASEGSDIYGDVDDLFKVKVLPPITDAKPPTVEPQNTTPPQPNQSQQTTASTKPKEDEEEKPIEDFDSLKILLEKHSLQPEEALMLILSGAKPLSEESKMAVWRSEVEASGFTEQEVYEAIAEALTGRITRKFEITIFKSRYFVHLKERTDVEDRLIQTALRDLYRETGGETTEEEVARVRIRWSMAASLMELDGFGFKIIRDESDPKYSPLATQQYFANELEKLSTLAFEQLSQCLAKIDQLVYLASKRISIENF